VRSGVVNPGLQPDPKVLSMKYPGLQADPYGLSMKYPSLQADEVRGN
jgi:hypothetical protein